MTNAIPREKAVQQLRNLADALESDPNLVAVAGWHEEGDKCGIRTIFFGHPVVFYSVSSFMAYVAVKYLEDWQNQQELKPDGSVQ